MRPEYKFYWVTVGFVLLSYLSNFGQQSTENVMWILLHIPARKNVSFKHAKAHLVLRVQKVKKKLKLHDS